MKKTVIKRRKRVPAAPGMSFSAVPTTSPGGRLTDQAAAEALVAVGRVRGVGGEDTEGDGEEEDETEEQEQQPPRKRRATRARGRGAITSTRRTRSSAEKDAMDVEEHEHEHEEGGSTTGAPEGARKRSGGGGGVQQSQNGWIDGRSASPHHHHQQHLHRVPSRNLAPHHPHHPHHPHVHDYLHQQYLHRTSPFAPQPGVGIGGFDLPPLAAMASPAAAAAGGPFAGLLGGGPGAPSSYIRSGSNAPSRTHSPSLPGGYPGGPPYYGGGPGDIMLMGLGIGAGGGVPSVIELERHYFELHESRRKLEEMVDRTDRLMLGVKRGIEEMRGQSASPLPGAGGSASASTGGNTQSQQEGGAVQEKNSPSSWPVDPKLSGSPGSSVPATTAPAAASTGNTSTAPQD